jgi:hypothetical protein
MTAVVAVIRLIFKMFPSLFFHPVGQHWTRHGIVPGQVDFRDPHASIDQMILNVHEFEQLLRLMKAA